MGTQEPDIQKKNPPVIVFFGHCFVTYGAEEISGNSLRDKKPFDYKDIKFLKDRFSFNAAFTEIGMISASLKDYIRVYLGNYVKEEIVKDPEERDHIYREKMREILSYMTFGEARWYDWKYDPEKKDPILDLMYQKSDRVNKPEQIAFILIGDNDIVSFAEDLINKQANVITNIKRGIEALQYAGIKKIVLVGPAAPAEGSEVYYNIGKLPEGYEDCPTLWNEMNRRFSRLAQDKAISFLQVPNDLKVGIREEDKWHYKDYRAYFKWVIEEGCKLLDVTEHPLLDQINRDDYLKPEYFQHMREERKKWEEENFPAPPSEPIPKKKNGTGFIENKNIIGDDLLVKLYESAIVMRTEDGINKLIFSKDKISLLGRTGKGVG